MRERAHGAGAARAHAGAVRRAAAAPGARSAPCGSAASIHAGTVQYDISSNSVLRSNKNLYNIITIGKNTPVFFLKKKTVANVLNCINIDDINKV